MTAEQVDALKIGDRIHCDMRGDRWTGTVRELFFAGRQVGVVRIEADHPRHRYEDMPPLMIGRESRQRCCTREYLTMDHVWKIEPEKGG